MLIARHACRRRAWTLMTAMLPLIASGIAAEAKAAEPVVVERPAAPPASVAALVGAYGEGSSLLDVSERDGRLMIGGGDLAETQMHGRGSRFRIAGQNGASAVVVTKRHGAVTALAIDGRTLPRRDPGAEVQARIREGVRADIEAIRARAMRLSPPVEAPAERAEDLVDLTRIVPGVRLDIRYAGTNNFMGVALYERPGAFLQRPAAEALAHVAEALRPLGYGLLIHDGYRPWYVTHMFWDATPESSHAFVADPSRGSRHNRGCAVDLTLYRLADGAVVEMPSRYDEMSVRAHVDYAGGTSRQRWERDLLRREMERQGFEAYPEEWWHYDFRDWSHYAVLNLSLPELIARGR